jgi:hypothetical protein
LSIVSGMFASAAREQLRYKSPESRIRPIRSYRPCSKQLTRIRVSGELKTAQFLGIADGQAKELFNEFPNRVEFGELRLRNEANGGTLAFLSGRITLRMLTDPKTVESWRGPSVLISGCLRPAFRGLLECTCRFAPMKQGGVVGALFSRARSQLDSTWQRGGAIITDSGDARLTIST